MAGNGKDKDGTDKREKAIRRYTPKRKVQKGNKEKLKPKQIDKKIENKFTDLSLLTSIKVS